MSPAVARSGSAWVEPIRPLKAEVVFCSAVENLCARVYPVPVVFFPRKPGDNVYTHFEYLRQGLSRVLYEIPILGGIIRTDERGANSIEIPEAPHAGTRFHFQDLSEDPDFPTYDHLARTGFPFADGVDDGLERFRPDPFPAAQDGDPVVVVQLTSVKGGIALYCAYSHLIGDLVVGRDILLRWAINTRAITEAALARQPPPPVFPQYPEALMDRSPLIPKVPGHLTVEEIKSRGGNLANFKPLDPTDVVGTMAELQNMMPKAFVAPNAVDDEDRLRSPTVGVWRFPQAQLKAIQKGAQESAPKGEKLSTMDAFTAFLWQRFFCAKYAIGSSDSEAPKQSTCCFAGDVRRRLNPPLPANYLPAAVDIFRATLPSEQLAPSNATAALGTVSLKLRQVNDTWDREEYKTLIELVHRAPINPSFIPRGPMDLLITDHSRASAIWASDWGPGLGKPAAFREPYLGRLIPAGEMTILPRQENGDMEVMIAGETVTMERLSADGPMCKMSQRQFIMHDVLEEAKKSSGIRPKL
ncbi:hypothetical protein B0A50_02352 [Salinomyces thailandicus]|uniref:Trichothecene 3-O-acetyltransferase-like N-terminal domain-containing protein n=1 Tax=Salinomyces thailandicus TaxID=706561 RepID=A0A4U0U7M7_9PEZI|nr:hypothetical protein B0A50_02352 [Salinomyces thailandica]